MLQLKKKQIHLLQHRNKDTSGGASTYVKVDRNAGYAAEFAIQGCVSHTLQQSEFFPYDRFMGDEDATDLHVDRSLQLTAFSMAHQLNPQLSLDDFLAVVGRGVKKRNEEVGDTDERVWILDPGRVLADRLLSRDHKLVALHYSDSFDSTKAFC